MQLKKFVQEPLISIYSRRTKLSGTQIASDTIHTMNSHYSLLPSGQRYRSLTFRTKGVIIRTEVSREGQRGVGTRQRGRCGGQDQTFPVACTTAIEEDRHICKHERISQLLCQSVCVCVYCVSVLVPMHV